MKKIAQKDFILLILLMLCFLFGEASAGLYGDLLPKNYLPSSFIYSEMVEPSAIPSAIDINSKKKKTKSKASKGKGKVNYDSFQQYYEKALKHYHGKAYLSAARIFEELYPLAIGTPLGDTILFLFADSYFQNRDYQMAAFHFRDYARRYPGTEKTELAALNAVKSMYYIAPEYYLDQFVTVMAIEEVNLFIQQYPYSKYIEECNEILDGLRDRLAKKELEMVRMYYQTGHYEAAQIMARNFLKTYASSKFAPEVLSVLVQNNFEFARKSIEQKKYHRFKDCLDAFTTLKAQYPESSFISEAQKLADEATIQIHKLEKK